jgi:phosphoribosyl 1,2-cyclic phosphodiesterase
MKIKPIASSSAGNCHAIEHAGQILLIDCGIPVKRIRKAIGGFENVVGCLISHEHGDHAGFAEQLRKETSFPICRTFQHRVVFRIGPFKITPVKLDHDAECFGFLILTETDSLFYATDTSLVDYNFPGLKKLMIEANFDFSLISESSLQDFVVQRTIRNHLDIDSAIDFIRKHPALEEVWLLHLSDGHSDAEMFRKKVIDAAGVPVYVAPK